MYVCMYVCMHGWMDGWMDVCMHAWMDGRMDGCMYACMYILYIYIKPNNLPWDITQYHQEINGIEDINVERDQL